MKKSRYTEEQIIAILKQHEAGVKMTNLCLGGWNQRRSVSLLELRSPEAPR